MASLSIDQIRQEHSRGGLAATSELSAVDDDISGMLDGFVSRMMADGGMVAHYCDGSIKTLATSGLLGESNSGLFDMVEATKAVAQSNGRRMNGPDPLMVWCGTTLFGGNGRALLLPMTCAVGEQTVTVAVYRQNNNGMSTSAAETMAVQLHPIVNGYVRLWNKARAQTRAVASLECALDSSAGAIALLDKAGEVRFLNRAMRRIVDGGDGLQLRGRTLVASDLAGSMRLQVAIGQALADATATTREPSTVALFLDRPHNKGALPVAVLAGSNSFSEPENAVVVIHAIDPTADLASSIRPICQVHGLSPVEASLVLRLTEGETLIDAAHSIRVKEQTARAYLKQIFCKTGVSRQSDLIRLMLTNALRVNCKNFSLPM